MSKVSAEVACSSMCEGTIECGVPYQGLIVPRPRLQAALRPVGSGGVVTVVAGPGCGKTAFLIESLTASDARRIYFSPGPGGFVPGKLAQALAEEAGARLAESHSLHARGIAQETDAADLQVVQLLLGELAPPPYGRLLIAVDDLHLLEPSTTDVRDLESLASHLPPRVTLLIASRRRVPFVLDGPRFAGRLVEIDSRRLRFTPREVAAWSERLWQEALDGAGARELWRVTQGWPAALVLLGQYVRQHRGEALRREVLSAAAKGRDLRRYLQEHVMSSLTPEEAEALTWGALTPRVVFPRDDNLFPGPRGRAEEIMEDLTVRGFLVTRTGRRTYRLHPLIRGAAETDLKSKEDGRALIGCAARHLEENGELQDAVSLYLRIGKVEAAVPSLKKAYAESPLNASLSFGRDDWPELITADMASAEPQLLVARAHALQQRARYEEAESLYREAATRLVGENDRAGRMKALLGAAFCLYMVGLWEDALRVLARAESISRTPCERAEVLANSGNVLLSLCRWDEAIERWERALAIVPDEERPRLVSRVYGYRARLFFLMGRYVTAAQWAERALRVSRGGPHLSHVMALNGLAILAYTRGQYERAHSLAEDCLDRVRTHHDRFLESSALLSLAAVSFGTWDYRAGLAKVREAQALSARAADAEDFAWAEEMLGDLCRRNRNPVRAREHHRRVMVSVDQSRLSVSEWIRAQCAIGMDLAVEGNAGEARDILRKVVESSRERDLGSTLVQSLFYLGWLEAKRGEEQLTRRLLSEATRLAQEHEHVHFLAQEATVAVPILALCDRLGFGSFIRGAVLPHLTPKLARYFCHLAQGSVYPTDVDLGPPRSLRHASATNRESLKESDRYLLAAIDALTTKEREVLQLIALGLSNKVVGNRLSITEKTVKTHANHVYRKLGVTSRMQAALAFHSYQSLVRAARR